MSINLVRVTHTQVLRPGISRNGSILLDKIDESQGNHSSPPYAQIRKQALYVPFSDPTTPSFAGYLDLIQTDNVKLASEHPDGVIVGLAARGLVTSVVVSSALIATPVITNAVAIAGDVTLTGTTFLSVLPTLTSVKVTPPGLATQDVPQANFSVHNATTITILDANITGTIVPGWTVQVFANNKLSNIFTVV
jgi:hypothetical protein